MNESPLVELIETLKERTPRFVAQMRDPTQPGQYRFSWSGDIVPKGTHWGLGQATFAARVLYILDRIDDSVAAEIATFILSFETQSGAIFDPLVARRSRLKRLVKGFIYLDEELLFNRQNKRAELRQALAALINLGAKPRRFTEKVPVTANDVTRFVDRLNWNKPWGAGSHVNHQLFFLRHFVTLDIHARKAAADKYFEAIKRYETHSGYHKPGAAPKANDLVGGLMKLYMAAAIFNRTHELIKKSHVDLCLDRMKATDACEHFNTIYVLSHCHQHLDYRRDEIIAFALHLASQWEKHFYPKIGGFSFNRNKSGSIYYGAVLTKGLDEPDLHGTAMFVWGLLIVSQIAGLDRKLGLRVPVL